MFSKELEALIEATLQDGVLTDQEKSALVKRAQKEGVDIDELDIYIQSIQQKRRQAEDEKEAMHEARTKAGSVVKCPNCGARIDAGTAVCPECGYAFGRNDAIETSMHKLAKQLEEIDHAKSGLSLGTFGRALGIDKTVEKKMQAIQSFPVPNNRGDLLDLLTSIQPMANKLGPKNGVGSNGNEEYGLAYWQLFCNCINKAKISFANDPAFAHSFEFYEKELKSHRLSSRGKLFISIGVAFTILVLAIIIPLTVSSRSNREKEPLIDEQYKELSAKIEALPMPTEDNYTECEYKASIIVWTDICSSSYETKKERAFNEKKENYLKLIEKFKHEEETVAEEEQEPAAEIEETGTDTVPDESVTEADEMAETEEDAEEATENAE